MDSVSMTGGRIRIYSPPMPDIHPTAVIEGDLDAADDVVIGPGCVISGAVRLGAGTRLVGHVYLQGPLEIGAGNTVYPFACVGFAGQHTQADPDRPGPGVVIGDDNTLRESVRVHRAFTDDGPTTIGDRNYLMDGSHVGHDCRVGDDCVLVTNAMLGGHVLLEDRVNIGGGCGVHQHVRIGQGAMLSGNVGATLDVPPWFTLTGINVCSAVNLIGLRRSGAPREDIDDARWAYVVICREDRSRSSMLERLRERSGRPMVDRYIEFIETARRGICKDRGKAARGTVWQTT